ncbi:MAG: hypothetical protein ABIZ49_13695 [Opitutaceae bacterium]
MTAIFQHQLRRTGAAFMVVCQQRCDAMRPVTISVWNKTGPGVQI